MNSKQTTPHSIGRLQTFGTTLLLTWMLVPFTEVVATEESVPIWQEYIQKPDTHRNLPNVSYAGYQYGEMEIPRIEGPVYNVLDYGATGDGQSDDGEAVRSALEAVGPEGGVVFFPRGQYRIDGLLFVHTNHTVLRGEDREGVELIFTQPLAQAWGVRELKTTRTLSEEQQKIVEQIREDYGDVITPGPTRYASRWSWSGGLIWFTPKARTTYREDPTAPVTTFGEGWLQGERIGTVIEPAKRGDRSVVLDTIPSIEAGDFLIVNQEDPGDFSFARHLSGDGPWAEAYKWEQSLPDGYPEGFNSRSNWVVEVASVDGPVITFRQPLRFDVRPEWFPEVMRLGDSIRESGIEDLTIRFDRKHIWETAGHNLYPGWNGPWFNGAIHCWLRRVTMINVDNGPGVSASKCVTLTDFRLEADRPEMMAHHHATTCRNRSHDCLFSDFQILTKPLHGLNVEQISSGNVWSSGHMEHGTFDTHRGMPFDNLRTEIVINNDGYHGGNGGPVMAARFVHWNIEVLNHRDYIIGWANAMPDGAIVGLRGAPVVWNSRPNQTPIGEELARTRVEAIGEVPTPANLYEAQLRHRLEIESDSTTNHP